MRNFWKDYAHLCKEAGRFYKKHWKGCILMNVAIIGAEMAYLRKDDIKEKIEEKFGRRSSP